MSDKSSTGCNVGMQKSASSESSCNDMSASFDPDLQASDRPEKLELYQEVKVVAPGTTPRETGATAEWCTECVRKGYTGHRCCDDVPGISRGPHRQASS